MSETKVPLRSRPERTFAGAFSDALFARSMSLSELKRSLERRGLSVAMGTLSYWRSGSRRPDPPRQRETIAEIEDILYLEPDDLYRLAVQETSASRTYDISAEVFNAEREADETATVVRLPSEYIREVSKRRVTDVGRDGHPQRTTLQVWLQATEAPVRRIEWPGVYETKGRYSTGLTITRDGHIADYDFDRDTGMLSIELFPPLDPGVTAVIEMSVEFGEGSQPPMRCEIVELGRVRQVTNWVRFHPDAVPTSVVEVDEIDGEEKRVRRGLNGPDSAHQVKWDFGPGTSRLEWDYSPGSVPQSSQPSSGVFENFAHALDESIEARALTLGQLQQEVALHGVPLSVATLSYWRSGARRPDANRSAAALLAIEDVLGLAPGELVSYLPGRSGRTGGVSQQDHPLPEHPSREGLLERLEADPWDNMRLVSMEQIIDVDANLEVASISTVFVIQCIQEPIETLAIIDSAPRQTSPLPRLSVVRGGYFDRIIESTDFSLGYRVVLDRPLFPGETSILEVRQEFGAHDMKSRYTKLGTWSRVRLVTQTFRFAHRPDWFEVDKTVDGQAKTRTLHEPQVAHLVHHNLGPGNLEARWGMIDDA